MSSICLLLEETIISSNKSFVSFQWSFAVVVWEILTKGALPYQGIRIEHIENHVVDQEKRLPKPRRLYGYADDV